MIQPTQQSGAVFWRPSTKPNPRLRMICFPYAGGGAGLFRGWDRQLEDVEICAVQPPGREWRRNEPPFTDAVDLVQSVFEAIPPEWFKTPYVIFGYSMGALLAYELTARILQAGLAPPQQLILAACKAPHLMQRSTPYASMDDTEFLDFVRRYGGIPDAVLAEPELVKLILPTLRADFEMLNTYRWSSPGSSLFSIPVIVYGGTRDSYAKRSELAAWQQCSSGSFTLRLFVGGHFFIAEPGAQMVHTLRQDLAASTDE
jgi:medium-chain acyl-[acyl-carrier-protein] hydrolase